MEDDTLVESSCKSRVACEYAQRSDELLEYVGFLETELQNIKSETRVTQAEHEVESRDLKEQLDVASKKLNEAHKELQIQLDSGREAQNLKNEFQKTENLLQEERKREKSRKSNRSIEEYIAEIGRSEKGEQIIKRNAGKALKSAQNHSDLQPTQRSFQPLESDIYSPRARFIVNCFDNPTATRREIFRPELETEESPRTDTSQSQIEVFQANPCMDVEHARMTGSTWAELKVFNSRAAECAEMHNCQSEIKRMLSNIEMSMAYLLEQERHRKWKEAQIKHLGYQPMQRVPESALWRRRPWQF